MRKVNLKQRIKIEKKVFKKVFLKEKDPKKIWD